MESMVRVSRHRLQTDAVQVPVCEKPAGNKRTTSRALLLPKPRAAHDCGR